MSDIDFLGHKNKNEEEKPEEAKKPEVVWSTPEPEPAGAKTTPFSWLKFLNKKKAEPGPVINIDQDKVRRSRREILRLIKNSAKPESGGGKRFGRNLFAGLRKKLARRPTHKEIMIDYQKIFNQEKTKRDQARPPVPEEKAAAKPESRPQKPAEPDTARPAANDVLETNLIKGEIVTFFDRRKKITVLASALTAAALLVGLMYFALVYYQKQNQAKNLAQAKRFEELTAKISRASADLKEISDFQNRLKLVSQIFSQHLYWTNFFKFLEDNTIKDVYYSDFSGDTSGSYSLDALAAKYSSIARQVEALKANPKVTAAQALGGEAAPGEGKNKTRVKFSLDFSILKTIFTD